MRRKLGRGALLVLFGALTLIFLEGAASLALLGRATIALGRGHTYNSPVQFDPELGWASIPNYRQAEKYGPGADVTINSQGSVPITTSRPRSRRGAIVSFAWEIR